MLSPALYLPAEMILELAIGAEPPLDVAKKHGFTPLDFTRMSMQSWFAEALLRERQRLMEEGYSFQAKARLMYQTTAEQLMRAQTAGQLKPEHSLKFLETMADMCGDRKVQQGPTTGGPAVQININIPTEQRGPTNVRELIEGARTQARPMMQIPVKPTKPAQAKLDALHKRIPLDNDLIGAPLPEGL